MFDNPKIHIKDKTSLQSKLTSFNLDKLQIVADFDNTITQDNGHTSWSLFGKSWLMPDEYNKIRNEYFDYYYPFEIDLSLPFEKRDVLMREWWQKHLELFVKYKLNINVIDNIIKDNSYFDFRAWMKEFMDLAAANNIPFIILSAWVTNTISEFLRFRDTLSSNLHIVSNDLKFDKDGFCIGINKDVIIHSENKDEHDMPENIKGLVDWKTDIILLWDSLADIKMIDESIREKALKIGFLGEKKMPYKDNFIETFDIVVESNIDSLEVPSKILQHLFN